MKTTTKKALIITAVAGVLSLTGCGNFLKYYLRQDPDKAMEEYLEEKYDDDVVCLEWSSEYGFIAYWDRANFGGKFESKKYPGIKIACSASLEEGGWTYEFHDNYQSEVYRAGVQEIMEKTAEKYFEGEYYVLTQCAGKIDDETVEAMVFEEYVMRYLRYSVCILAEEMDEADAIDAMQDFVTDVQNQGFQCSFYLGKANTNIISKEDFYLEFQEKGDEFEFNVGNGIESITKWLYKYNLPITEGKSEPKIFIIDEEIE